MSKRRPAACGQVARLFKTGGGYKVSYEYGGNPVLITYYFTTAQNPGQQPKTVPKDF
jgi:hypothetical protein